MTSVSVDDINGRIAVAIQEEAYNKNGKLVVLDYEGNYITSYEAGVQPDMITFADNGNLILSANEENQEKDIRMICLMIQKEVLRSWIQKQIQ